MIQSHTNESTCGLHTTFFHIAHCILNAITEEHSSQVGVGQKLMGCQQISGHINSHTRAEEICLLEMNPDHMKNATNQKPLAVLPKRLCSSRQDLGSNISGRILWKTKQELCSRPLWWTRCISRVGPPPLDPIGSVTNQCLPHFIIERSCQNLVCLHDRANYYYHCYYYFHLN